MARMIARNPTPGEVERAAEVAAAAFPNLPLEHWQESFHTAAEMFGERFILVVEMGGRLVSSMLCGPAPIVVGGAEVTHAAVGAVGTLPECRNQGCAGVMMTQCVKLLRDEGICTSSLWPFSYRYYRKFGWEVGAEARTYDAQGKVFAELGDASKARPATNDDFEAIKSVYRRLLPTYNCGTVRSDEWWRKVARLPDDLTVVSDTGCGVVVHELDGRLDGYAVYKISDKDGEKDIGVQELSWSSAESRLDMLALLGNVNPEGSLTFNAPLDDLLLQTVPDPRAIHVTVNPSFQFRVIDPERAMESLMPDDEVECRLTFSLSDPVFKHGFEFGIEVEEGHVSLCKPERSNRLEMDVQTLAKLYSGYLNAIDACTIGQLRASGLTEVLEADGVFSALTPYRSRLDPG